MAANIDFPARKVSFRPSCKTNPARLAQFRAKSY
jgi:hypothetical protein